MIAIRPPHASELPLVKTLLADSDLPTADFERSVIDWLVAVTEDERLAGSVGLELFGDVGLLRSLAVARDFRGAGTGASLVRHAEAHAIAAGVRRLVLLTQTAEAFFTRKGYLRIDRGAAPAALQHSAEFRSLCPASATCMSRMLP